MSNEVDFIEEIHIAQFWRKHLGEYEYVYFNPDDLRRWYIALETRGPQDIRELLIERTGRYPMGEITGIVAVAPHPSRRVIDLWLESHSKIHTRPYWLAFVAFLVFTYYAMTNLAGLQNIPAQTYLQLNPPTPSGPQFHMGSTPLPAATATAPANLPAPASVAARPTGSLGNSQQH